MGKTHFSIVSFVGGPGLMIQSTRKKRLSLLSSFSFLVFSKRKAASFFFVCIRKKPLSFISLFFLFLFVCSCAFTPTPPFIYIFKTYRSLACTQIFTVDIVMLRFLFLHRYESHSSLPHALLSQLYTLLHSYTKYLRSFGQPKTKDIS